MEELEAEAILLRGSLDELTGVEQHGTDPLAVLIGLIDQQDAWLQHTPQLGPALQRATDLREIKRDRMRLEVILRMFSHVVCLLDPNLRSNSTSLSPYPAGLFPHTNTLVLSMYVSL